MCAHIMNGRYSSVKAVLRIASSNLSLSIPLTHLTIIVFINTYIHTVFSSTQGGPVSSPGLSSGLLDNPEYNNSLRFASLSLSLYKENNNTDFTRRTS